MIFNPYLRDKSALTTRSASPNVTVPQVGTSQAISIAEIPKSVTLPNLKAFFDVKQSRKPCKVDGCLEYFLLC